MTEKKPIDMQAALLDPPSVFDTPEDISTCEDLPDDRKIEILRRWEYDARELEVAADEGMIGADSDLLDRIHDALHDLGATIDLDHTPPTKQGGVAASDIHRGSEGPDEVDAATIAAMSEALEDEYKARATYRAVIAAFGPTRPFINIVEAETRHANALLALFQRFGLTPPADNWADRTIQVPETLTAACAAAVAGEIENAEMYDRLLAKVRHPAVRDVLQNLQAASRDNHLPAFQRCLQRESGMGGNGQGRRRRRRGR